MLINAVGESRCVQGIETRFCSLRGQEVCVIVVAPSSEPVFLKGEGSDQFYVRVGNSTRVFGMQEAFDFAQDRWGARRCGDRALASLRYSRRVWVEFFLPFAHFCARLGTIGAVNLNEGQKNDGRRHSGSGCAPV